MAKKKAPVKPILKSGMGGVPEAYEDIRKQKNPLRVKAKEMPVGGWVMVADFGKACRFVTYLKDAGFTGTLQKQPDGTYKIWKLRLTTAAREKAAKDDSTEAQIQDLLAQVQALAAKRK
jgi:hypothetical protein